MHLQNKGLGPAKIIATQFRSFILPQTFMLSVLHALSHLILATPLSMYIATHFGEGTVLTKKSVVILQFTVEY